MSTNRITSFSGLWSPTEYRNVEAGKVTIGTIPAGWLSARLSEDNPHPAEFGQKFFFHTRSGANRESSYGTHHLPADHGRPTGPQKALADEFYYLDPYSGGGSGTIYVC